MSAPTRVPRLLLSACLLLAGSGTARATDICGVIAETLTIVDNSQLVCDVVCTSTTGPCIDLAASHIKLRLNGFTITGPGSPPEACNATSGPPMADGIRIANQTNVEVVGPGMVEKFRRHGVFVQQSSRITVKQITSHHNCFSGLLMNGLTDSDIEENVSVRNAVASASTPCGGNCLVNSHNNRIRRNEFNGNGAALSPAGPSGTDFGVGLLFGSSGNVVEENNMGGNTNGILLHPTATGNVIRRNVVAGNPPAQISATFGPVGVDIHDQSPPGANTFEENLCVTYLGAAAPPPCPNFPKFSGHRNTSQASSKSP